MNICLAQLPAIPSDRFGEWTIAFAAMAAVVLLVLKIISQIRAWNTPEDRYASKQETDLRFHQMHQELESLRSEQCRLHAEILHAGEDRASKIQLRMNDIVDAIGKLSKEIGKIQGRCAAFHNE